MRPRTRRRNIRARRTTLTSGKLSDSQATGASHPVAAQQLAEALPAGKAPGASYSHDPRHAAYAEQSVLHRIEVHRRAAAQR